MGDEVEIGDENTAQAGQQVAKFVDLVDEDVEDEKDEQQHGGEIKQGGGSQYDAGNEQGGFAVGGGGVVDEVQHGEDGCVGEPCR